MHAFCSCIFFLMFKPKKIHSLPINFFTEKKHSSSSSKNNNCQFKITFCVCLFKIDVSCIYLSRGSIANVARTVLLLSKSIDLRRWWNRHRQKCTQLWTPKRRDIKVVYSYICYTYTYTYTHSYYFTKNSYCDWLNRVW